MTAVLLTPPRLQFFDNNGDPLAGGLVYTYAAGTTTPKATYTDQGGLTPNANPVVLDSSGRASIWVSGAYKIVVKTSAGVQISSDDNITSFSSGAVTSAVSDSGFVIQNASDPTKQVQFDASAVTTGTTTTISIPNGNGTMATQAWVTSQLPSTNPGWVPIKTVTASSSATVDFVHGSGGVVLDSTYKKYIIEFTTVVPQTDTAEIRFLTSSNAGSSWDNSSGNYGDVGGTGAFGKMISGASLGNSTGENLNGSLEIYDPSNSTKYKIFGVHLNYFSSAGVAAFGDTSAARISTSAIDGIRIYMSTGNIASGTFILYGIKSA